VDVSSKDLGAEVMVLVMARTVKLQSPHHHLSSHRHQFVKPPQPWSPGNIEMQGGPDSSV
jgi:hypothetical protein